ncbi:MAG: hypothetical protein HYU51_06145 [Candidatus Rokubacteria bacterium]|nr:hypothetical protein [Candidatus Rokubacteria bacterium]
MRPGAGRAPAPILPLAYLVTASSALVLAALGVVVLAPALAGHYYQPRVLALTHTVTLGWITTTILGASYQLVPLVLVRTLWSERTAWWTLAALMAGLVGMVSHFWLGHWSGLAWAAALVLVAVAAHVVNVGLTLRGLGRWSFTARLLAGALAGLSATAVLGLVLGADKVFHVLGGDLFATLHAHVQLALLGWVLPMVVGVSARVYPMFLQAREPEGRAGSVQLAGLALGVPAVVLGLVTGLRPLVVLGALAVAAAVVGHLVWIGTIVRTGRRPAIDWALSFALTGTLFVVPATAVGLALALDVVSGPRFALVYAVLVLGGWASLTIVGMILKIVPFLVWYLAYGPFVGRASVPKLGDVSVPAAERIAYALLVPGMAGLAFAVGVGSPVLIRLAGLVVLAGTLGFAVALLRMLRHVTARRTVTPAAAPSLQTPGV